eukprot:TRINITY_DN70314_c0_g1_i1.p1 TRINITY_DN70314_c0_g1~~TRINITY_DN70314_c0_g1_i1.p1  ORF type:complete len:153 (-),score=8.56 TRINITY_DN70314_c0_g1_i1:177-635(-)
MTADFGKRVLTELNNLKKPENRIEGIDIVPYPGNPRLFDIYITGPEGCPFQGGRFHLQLFLPKEYPIRPPLVYFVTKIYHPNVDQLGRICLDTLGDKWSPALQIPKVCLSILSLLQDPNPKDPLDNQIAEVWLQKPAIAHQKAREWTARFAK